MTSFVQMLIDKWEGNDAGLREDYREKLQHGAWIVEFTKTDGTPAVMECTLDPRLLPPKVESAGSDDKPDRPEPEHLLHCYSMDRKGWRSFVVKNVTAFYKKPTDVL